MVVTQQWRIGRTILLIYAIAVLLNYVWELAESPLYVGIGQLQNIWWHCGIAAIGDGFLVLIIYLAGWLVFRDPYCFGRLDWRGCLLILGAGLFVGIGIEFLAVNIFRLWAYTPTMPLLPGLGVGLAPVTQMVILPALTFYAVAVWQGNGIYETSMKNKRRKIMRIVSRMLLLLVLGVVLVTPLSGHAQKTKPAERTLTGFVSDNQCGLKHMPGMGDDKSCALMCAKNGKFVLADQDHKRVYQLDKMGQEKAREFAGQKVKVTGRITSKTIRVTAIEAVS